MGELEQKIAELEERVSKLEFVLSEKPETLKKNLSLREFFMSVNPQKDIQKSATICYYLEKYQGLTSMNILDLEKGYREAKETIPKDNLGYKFFMMVKKGWLMEAEDKKDNMKAYVLTNTGISEIENKFKSK